MGRLHESREYKNKMLESESMIFKEINSSPQVQRYLDQLCTSLLDCAYFMALEQTFLKSCTNQNSNKIPFPEPYHFDKELSSILFHRAHPNPKDTGSVLNQDVVSVLAHGNVRERCYQLLNIFCRDKNSSILKWLVMNTGSNIPSSVNNKRLGDMCARFESAFSALKGSERFKTLMKECFLLMKRKFFVSTRARNRVRRRCKSCEGNEFRISASDVVPPLSSREHKVVGKFVKSNKDKLPWITGRLQWMVKSEKNCQDRFGMLKEEMVSGLSGHTESFLFYLPLFDCFDLELTVLVCVVWLVPCDHHSIKEILCTAREYGLVFSSSEDPVQICLRLLRNAEKRQVRAASA